MNNQSIAILTNIAIQLVHKEREEGIFGLFYSTCRNLLNSVMNRDQLIDRGETTSRFVLRITRGYIPEIYPELVHFVKNLNNEISGFGKISFEDTGECFELVYQDQEQGGLA